MIYFIHLPKKMEPIVSSETSAIRTQTPGNYPIRNKLQMLMTSTSGIQILNIYGILVTKSHFSLNICTIELYVLGSKIKQKFYKF